MTQATNPPAWRPEANAEAPMPATAEPEAEPPKSEPPVAHVLGIDGMMRCLELAVQACGARRSPEFVVATADLFAHLVAGMKLRRPPTRAGSVSPQASPQHPQASPGH